MCCGQHVDQLDSAAGLVLPAVQRATGGRGGAGAYAGAARPASPAAGPRSPLPLPLQAARLPRPQEGARELQPTAVPRPGHEDARAADTSITRCRDNLSAHLVQELSDLAEANKGWLRVFQLPGHATELNPVEGIRSPPRRGIFDFVASSFLALERIMKRKLKKIQYRPNLTDGCLA